MAGLLLPIHQAGECHRRPHQCPAFFAVAVAVAAVAVAVAAVAVAVAAVAVAAVAVAAVAGLAVAAVRRLPGAAGAAAQTSR